jgi:hypothetical protein
MGRAPLRIMNVQLRIFAAALLATIAGTAGGCASPSGEDETSSDDAALQSAQGQCTAAAYNEALSFYKRAVAGANERARVAVCDWDESGYQYEIAKNAEKAVNTCSAFEHVIKTSVYAAKVRAALDGTLTYRIVTGDLDRTSWSGLASALVGVSLEGGQGHADRWELTFGEGGKGTLQTHEVDAQGEEVWPVKPITWSVAQRRGQTFVIVVGRAQSGTTVTYDYLLQHATDDGRSEYVLTLQGDPDAAFPAAERFFDLATECGG